MTSVIPGGLPAVFLTLVSNANLIYRLPFFNTFFISRNIRPSLSQVFISMDIISYFFKKCCFPAGFRTIYKMYLKGPAQKSSIPVFYFFFTINKIATTKCKYFNLFCLLFYLFCNHLKQNITIKACKSDLDFLIILTIISVERL